MSTATAYRYLEPRLGSSYKQLFIKGTKFRASQIYSAACQRGDEDDLTPEQVAEDYSIPVEAVYEAIRYCESKPVEVAYDFRREELHAEAAGQTHPEYRYNPQKYHRSLTADDSQRIEAQLRDEFGTDFLSYVVDVRPRTAVGSPPH
jgi:uncharacterized protein (DUF433 family)